MVADQEFITLIGQIIVGVSTVLLTIFKYREFIGFLWKLLQLLWKPIKCAIDWIKLAHKIEAAQIRSDEKVLGIEDTLAKLDKFMRDKLSPNGGSSFADAVKRIENRQIVSDSRQTALLNDSKMGVFFCDLHGRNTWVNKTYARFLDCGTNELIGFAWRKFIRTEELARYSKILEAAFKDGCEFEETVEFVNAHGQRVNLHISFSAVLNEKNETISYIGQVTAL
mgnify:CR=1 FL=1